MMGTMMGQIEKITKYVGVRKQLWEAMNSLPTRLPKGTLRHDPVRVLDPVFTAAVPFYFAAMDAVDDQFLREEGVTIGWVAAQVGVAG